MFALYDTCFFFFWYEAIKSTTNERTRNFFTVYTSIQYIHIFFMFISLFFFFYWYEAIKPPTRNFFTLYMDTYIHIYIYIACFSLSRSAQ